MHGLVGLAVGHVSVASAVVVGRGVDAAVVGPPLVEEVRLRVSRVTEATPASSSSSTLCSASSVEPALVAVVAGGVAGQGVAAGVTGVLGLTLQRT